MITAGLHKYVKAKTSHGCFVQRVNIDLNSSDMTVSPTIWPLLMGAVHMHSFSHSGSIPTISQTGEIVLPSTGQWSRPKLLDVRFYHERSHLICYYRDVPKNCLGITGVSENIKSMAMALQAYNRSLHGDSLDWIEQSGNNLWTYGPPDSIRREGRNVVIIAESTKTR